MTSVRLSQVTQRFGTTLAVDDISLQIPAGELFFVLGPSGCGKSTLLRLIAGLATPSDGKIFFNDRDVTTLPTQQRSAVMCFQSYALWPHMTVRQNVEFGLRLRGLSRADEQARLAEALALVRMESLAQRLPAQLSGGQQQRVALARALAVRPACLLLDEPLSNLDAQLRLEMRGEIRRICKSAGCTTIYVTHDQKEALSVADRLAVLKDGKVAQIGTPQECYQKPLTSFVAAFLGQTNLIPGTIVHQRENTVQVQTPIGLISASATETSLPADVIVSIRPERIRPAASAAANRLSVQVLQTNFLGDTTELTLDAAGHRLLMSMSGPIPNAPQQFTVEFDASDALAMRS